MTTRPYRSTLREQAAASTRAAILDAAEELFAQDGYARVTIGRIAQAAGVAPNTVYVAFGNKVGLVRGLTERASGEDSIQETLAAIAESDDAEAIVDLTVRSTGDVVHGHRRLMTLLIANAAADPEIGATLQGTERLLRERFGLITGRLATLGALRPDLDADQATDLLTYYLSPESWLRLDALGWDPDASRSWLRGQLGLALLGSGSDPGRGSGGDSE
ncbi:TetR/AcrR family transcriptional regulator [Promicromonospora kroppenstedtii]|uniref:TetR/AcrR family transcriptional regulator n=1 Tax=Promicromonospora kroppenstedtii TaxID=440482 RepID=A0ABW7XGK9_9MICO